MSLPDSKTDPTWVKTEYSYPNNLDPRPCKDCNSTFKPKRKQQLYCNIKCKNNYWNFKKENMGP